MVYLDNFSISALLLVMVLITLFVISNMRSTKTARMELAQMQGKLHQLAQSRVALSEQARDMCRVIRKVYPQAQFGHDFTLIENDGHVFIKDWSLPGERPDQATLDGLLHEYQQEAANYRAKRLDAYPSVGDQLDALFKARQGDMAMLHDIDRRIAEVKEEFPRHS